MIRCTSLAVASFAFLALMCWATGCQKAGHAEADVDASRPQVAAETTVAETATTTYGVPYIATTDTPWMRASTDTTGAGTIRSGDLVYMRADAARTGIVGARTPDGRVIYVRAADFRPK